MENKEFKPATKRQTWALKCATGIDYIDKNLSFDEASKLLQENNEKTGYSKSVKSEKKTILHYLASNESIQTLKKAICNEIEIKSIIENDPNFFKKEKNQSQKFVFLGGGCGFSRIIYDKRSFKCKEIIDKANQARNDINNVVKQSFEKEVIDYLKFYFLFAHNWLLILFFITPVIFSTRYSNKYA
jgi:hypothetical protein